MAYTLHTQRKTSGESTPISQTPPPQPKTVPQGKNRFFMLLLGIGLLLFLIWAGVTWWEQEQTLAKMEAELEVLAEQVEQAKREQEELLLEQRRLHDPEYIAEIARRDYFLSREGETLFKVVE